MSEYIAKCNEVVGISGATVQFPEYIDMDQEIVRCRDCGRRKHRVWCEWSHRFVTDNGFCAWGERRIE